MSGDYVFPLPQNLEPTKFRCVTFYVPDEVDWYMSFWGWLYEMGYGKRYQKNPTKDGVRVAAVWQKVIDDGRVNFLKRLCEPPVDRGDEFEEDMNLCDNIRFQNGVLQVKCCGEWVAVDGQSTQGAGGGGQPGAGAPQPGPQTCQNYGGDIGGGGPWYLPTTVNSGDTLELSGMGGAFYGGSLYWYCPDGSRFIGGICTGITDTNAGSQLPSVPIGRLIAQIGSTYYDIQPGPFTVPAGYSNAPVTLVQNTPTLVTGDGDVSFTITVCNNQPLPGVIDITYSGGLGVGPATCKAGDVLTITSVFYSPSGDYVGYPQFSQCVKIQVLSVGGYTPDPRSNATFWTWKTCDGTNHVCDRPDSCDGSDPTVFDITACIEEYQLISSTPFTMVIKVLAAC